MTHTRQSRSSWPSPSSSRRGRSRHTHLILGPSTSSTPLHSANVPPRVSDEPATGGPAAKVDTDPGFRQLLFSRKDRRPSSPCDWSSTSLGILALGVLKVLCSVFFPPNFCLIPGEKRDFQAFICKRCSTEDRCTNRIVALFFFLLLVFQEHGLPVPWVTTQGYSSGVLLRLERGQGRAQEGTM